MALVELRQILLLLIFCTCGLALINVETNNYISQSEKNLTETREEISANGDSLWNSFFLTESNSFTSVPYTLEVEFYWFYYLCYYFSTTTFYFSATTFYFSITTF